MSHLQSIYLWSMLCVNISVGNQFDLASIRTNQLVIGLIVCHFVDRQRPKIIIGFAVSHCRRFTMSKNSGDHALIVVKSVTKHLCVDYIDFQIKAQGCPIYGKIRFLRIFITCFSLRKKKRFMDESTNFFLLGINFFRTFKISFSPHEYRTRSLNVGSTLHF